MTGNCHVRFQEGRGHTLPLDIFCSEFIKRKYVTLDIGKWWGRSGGEYRDIDIVADVSDGKNTFRLYCECKFRHKEASYEDYQELKDAVDELNEGKRSMINYRYVIFSVSGFSDSLSETAEDDPRLILLGMEDLVSDGSGLELLRGDTIFLS